MVVLAASAYENTAGIALLDRVAAQTGTVKKALVDQGFKHERGFPMNVPDPDRPLLDKVDAREAVSTREAEQTRTRIEELTAKLRELDEAIDHLRITRKTLLSLAAEAGPEPAHRLRNCPAIPPTSRF